MNRADLSTLTFDKTSASNPPQRKWLRRFMIIALSLVCLLATGAIYQMIMTMVDQRAYPPPGQLISVGDHKLHIHCVGTGTPTVILESGGGMLSSHWAWVQSGLAGATRVCAYDRAGSGWSERGPLPRDAQQMAAELHTLLAQARIDGPYLLVGHSIGGLYMRAFAAQFPDQVAGLVLVDSSHPDQMTRSPETKAEQEGFVRLFKWVPLLARLGIVRIAGMAAMTTADLPATERAAAAAFFNAAAQHTTMLAEIAAWESTAAQARALKTLDNKPLLVISAGENSSSGWSVLQQELTNLSANSRQLVVERATHQGLLVDEESARMTSEAILQVIEALRSGAPLASR
jgi:pimeloyl-ACP methyl ester carboxylesterase